MKTLFQTTGALLCAAALLAPASAAPDATAKYPDRPITFVVPFAAGGSTTILARMLAEKLTHSMGETWVVENKPGAGGNIGMSHVARAKPDGYTLLMGPIGLAINPAIYANMSFDPIEDLMPVGRYAQVPNVLVTHPDLPIKSVAELIAYARENPGKLPLGSNGVGTSSHLAGEMLKSTADIDLLHVPYKGGGPALQDLLGGQISLLFDQVPLMLPQIQSGRLRALAVTSEERSPMLPDVPTMAEAGLPGYKMAVWFGVLAPAGTPEGIVEKLNVAMNDVLQDQDFQAALAKLGVQALPGTPEEFRDYLREETALWGDVVKKAGVTPQ